MLRCSPLVWNLRPFLSVPLPPLWRAIAWLVVLRAGHANAASAVVDFPQTEETDGRRAGGTPCIGDDVAMGGVSVGGSWWQGKSAVVHRVNPVEGEEWVLVIDWVAVQE